MRKALAILTIAALLAPAAAQDPSPSPADAAPQLETAAESAPSPSPAPEEQVAGGESSAEAPSTTDEPAPSAAPQTPQTPETLETQEDIISLDNMPELALPDDALVEPAALVPDMPPPAPVTPESVVQRQRDLTIQYREARVKFEKEPEVAALRQKADHARSPEARRAALREYYRLLLKKIAASNKELEEKCKAMEKAYLRRLAQTRIEPTIPLEPPPTPEPLD